MKDIIRSVPRGNVQIIVNACQNDCDYSNSPQVERTNNTITNQVKLFDDAQSVSSNSTCLADQHSSAGMSIFSLPLPSDKKSKVYTLPRQLTSKSPPSTFNRESNINLLPPNDFASKTDKVAKYLNLSKPASISNYSDVCDDASDMISLPPAPPRPDISNLIEDARHEEDIADDESDIESMFSCIPAAPPPVRNFKIPLETIDRKEQNTQRSNRHKINDSNKTSNQNQTVISLNHDQVTLPLNHNRISSSLDQINSDNKAMCDSDECVSQASSGSNDIFDDGKSGFYIPPPPPPVNKEICDTMNQEPLYYVLEKETEDKNNVDIKKKLSLELSKHLVDRKMSKTNNYSEITPQNTYVDIDHFERRRSNSTTRKSSLRNSLKKEKSSLLDSSIDTKTLRHDDEIDSSSSPNISVGVTEIYYPKNSLYHRDNKKKSLFSRLKSKLLLPSKSNIKEYEGVKENKKKQKQRPLSAINFADKKSRNTLKAAISQPDLTTHFPTSRMKKSESMDDRTFCNEFRMSTNDPFSLSVEQAPCDIQLSHSPLPRILSLRKPKECSPDKKKKRVGGNSRNISPPPFTASTTTTTATR